jgi:calcineurin-like phosphoesterase family protein
MLLTRIPFCYRFSLIAIALLLSTLMSSGQASYQKPALSNKESWSVIMLPDPQTYMKFARNQPIFDLMTSWIQENIDTLNIKLAVCTGDLVEQNDLMTPDGVNGNQNSLAQWRSVSGAFSRLDGRLPYVVTAGNHDYGYVNAGTIRKSNLYKYFPVDKNLLNQQIVREVAPNAEGIPSLENAAYEITSPKGRKILVISLEFAPRDTILGWAKKVISKPVYKNHTVIILTHSFVNEKNVRPEKENYNVDGNFAEAIWKKLVATSTNVQLVLSGHICAPDDFRAHVGFRTDKNAAGKTVNQMAFNAQALGGGWNGNGGDGWLRILEFMPDDKTVKVKTFSPFFAISPSTRQLAWQHEPYNEFTFTLD